MVKEENNSCKLSSELYTSSVACTHLPQSKQRKNKQIPLGSGYGAQWIGVFAVQEPKCQISERSFQTVIYTELEKRPK